MFRVIYWDFVGFLLSPDRYGKSLLLDFIEKACYFTSYNLISSLKVSSRRREFWPGYLKFWAHLRNSFSLAFFSIGFSFRLDLMFCSSCSFGSLLMKLHCRNHHFSGTVFSAFGSTPSVFIFIPPHLPTFTTIYSHRSSSPISSFCIPWRLRCTCIPLLWFSPSTFFWVEFFSTHFSSVDFELVTNSSSASQ